MVSIDFERDGMWINVRQMTGGSRREQLRAVSEEAARFPGRRIKVTAASGGTTVYTAEQVAAMRKRNGFSHGAVTT
jgi:hypothetical protein